jgi:hypothetical protein
MTSNDLGDFPRAHGACLRPENVGIGMAFYGRRRFAGSGGRRAVLAGINTTYFGRMEQAGTEVTATRRGGWRRGDSTCSTG